MTSPVATSGLPAGPPVPAAVPGIAEGAPVGRQFSTVMDQAIALGPRHQDRKGHGHAAAARSADAGHDKADESSDHPTSTNEREARLIPLWLLGMAAGPLASPPNPTPTPAVTKSERATGESKTSSDAAASGPAAPLPNTKGHRRQMPRDSLGGTPALNLVAQAESGASSPARMSRAADFRSPVEENDGAESTLVTGAESGAAKATTRVLGDLVPETHVRPGARTDSAPNQAVGGIAATARMFVDSKRTMESTPSESGNIREPGSNAPAVATNLKSAVAAAIRDFQDSHSFAPAASSPKHAMPTARPEFSSRGEHVDSRSPERLTASRSLEPKKSIDFVKEPDFRGTTRARAALGNPGQFFDKAGMEGVAQRFPSAPGVAPSAAQVETEHGEARTNIEGRPAEETHSSLGAARDDSAVANPRPAHLRPAPTADFRATKDPRAFKGSEPDTHRELPPMNTDRPASTAVVASGMRNSSGVFAARAQTTPIPPNMEKAIVETVAEMLIHLRNSPDTPSRATERIPALSNGQIVSNAVSARLNDFRNQESAVHEAVSGPQSASLLEATPPTLAPRATTQTNPASTNTAPEPAAAGQQNTDQESGSAQSDGRFAPTDRPTQPEPDDSASARARVASPADSAVQRTGHSGQGAKTAAGRSAEGPGGGNPARFPASFASGMSAAPNADDMQVTQQLNKNAGTAEQNLPGLTMTAELPPLPLDRNGKLRVADADTAVSSTDGAAFLGLASQSAGSDFATHEAAATLPATVRHLVGDSIIAMKQTGLDSVSVTLKPDNDTQLALHLKMQHGRLEALAVVERGDLSVLGAEWSHLQSRLAEQGVRLAPLISSADHSSWFSNKNFSSPQQGHREMPFQDLPFQMMAKPGARKAGARIANPANGSEWWA